MTSAAGTDVFTSRTFPVRPRIDGGCGEGFTSLPPKTALTAKLASRIEIEMNFVLMVVISAQLNFHGAVRLKIRQ
jgi:hypothetical protein